LFDERLAAADDYLWLLEMHRKGVKFHFNPKLESNYHMHGGNLTGEAPGFWRQMFQVHWYDKTPGWDCLTMKAPTDIQVEPTTRCGLKCKMCIRSADQEIRDITPETLWKILTAHPESRLVKLQGLGEPFMHPQLDILAMMVRAAGKYAITITNGQPENVVPWSRYFNEVMFSLDYIKGPAPASAHEGSPKKVIGKILEIKEKYPEVNLTINQVISADTRDRDICDVETFCSDHCIKLIRNRIANWHSNPSKGIAEMVALDRAIHGPLDPFDPHCPWGFTWAYYDARGRLHPCCVRMSDEYLMDGGWNDPAMQEFRRQRLDGGCETCKRCPD
jgi:MoaA/NifB/PqqE/SkfB family radical SAM enzyme